MEITFVLLALFSVSNQELVNAISKPQFIGNDAIKPELKEQFGNVLNARHTEDLEKMTNAIDELKNQMVEQRERFSLELQELKEQLDMQRTLMDLKTREQTTTNGIVQELRDQLKTQEQRFSLELEELRQQLNLELRDAKERFALKSKTRQKKMQAGMGQLKTVLQDLEEKFLQLKSVCAREESGKAEHSGSSEDILLKLAEEPSFSNVSEISSPSSQRLKRSDDMGPLAPVLNQVTQRVTEMASQIQAIQNVNAQQEKARGTTFIRWGYAACPGSAELVYTGILSGSHQHDTGGGASNLCLTSEPALDNHVQPSANGYSTIYGSEYEINPETEGNLTPACAVCRISRAANVMIPGTTVCTTGWTKEYSGYIMAGYYGYTGFTEYLCVDSNHGYVHTNKANDDQNSIYYTHVKCGALPCPPYVNDKLLTCVVCSK